MTIKIAHIADTHLGYKQYGLIEREKDFYDSFDNIIDDIIEKDVDYVIHCGDLFEHPKPPINALLCAQKGFLKLIDNNIDIFVIAGNHDIVQKRETSIPQRLYENEHFHILTIHDRYIEVNNDLVIAGLPFIQKSHEAYVKQMLYETYEDVKEYKHKILMLHGGITKHFDFNPEFELDTIPEGFDYYAMGHIHERKIEKDFRGGILSYPGSTEIINKGENTEYKENGKGYNLLTIDDNINVEYVNINLEREFIVKNIKYPELDQRIEELENYIKREILSKTDKKPVLILTVKEGDFERSDVDQRIKEKLENISLTIRINYEPTEITDSDDKEPKYKRLTPEKLIKDQVSESFDNEIGEMSVELYTVLSTKNLEKALEITDDFYNKKYSDVEGEENDNQ